VARIVFLERRKYLTLTLSERLKQFSKPLSKRLRNP
jgi:hypothetical protein